MFFYINLNKKIVSLQRKSDGSVAQLDRATAF